MVDSEATTSIGLDMILIDAGQEQTKDDQIRSLEKHILASQALKDACMLEKDKIIRFSISISISISI